MNKLLRVLGSVAALALGFSSQACAQVSYDGGTGNYTVMVYGDDGHLVPMVIPSPGRVQVQSVGSVVALPEGRFRYRWVVKVDPHSPDPLGTLWVPCPNGSQVDTIRLSRGSDPGHTMDGFRHQESDLQHCNFFMRIDAGDSLVAELVSDYLPAFGDLRAQGFVSGHGWPTTDPVPDNDKFAGLVDSLSGLNANGIHVTVPSAVPTRSPNALAQPNIGIGLLISDLRSACSKEWLSPRGVCQSLEVKLTAAQQSLARGNRNATLAQIHAFRQELTNQERTHVSPEAAAVLDVSASWIESHL